MWYLCHFFAVKSSPSSVSLCYSLLWSTVCLCLPVKVPLFQDMPVNFLCELCTHVVRYVFSPGEVIIHSDEPVHEIYIVHRGICQVTSNELSLWRSHRHYTGRNFSIKRVRPVGIHDIFAKEMRMLLLSPHLSRNQTCSCKIFQIGDCCK